MVPHVTLLYAGLTGLLITLVGMNVTRLRAALKVGATDAPPKPLQLAIRAHGNAVEWSPTLLLLLLVVELSGGTSLWLHLAGGLLLLGRVLHAASFLAKVKTGAPGMALTWAVGLWLPTWALVLHFTR